MQPNEIYEEAKDILSDSIMFKFLEQFEYRYDVLQFIAMFSSVPYFEKEMKIKRDVFGLADKLVDSFVEAGGHEVAFSKEQIVSIILTSVLNKDEMVLLEVGEESFNENFIIPHLHNLFSDCRSGDCYPYIGDSDNIFFRIGSVPNSLMKKIDAEVIKRGLMELNK